VFFYVISQEIRMHTNNIVSTVTVFDIDGADERGFETWLLANRENGYVGNIPRKGENTPVFLHAVKCSTWTKENGPFVNPNYYKVCATDAIDLLNWIHHHGPFQFIKIHGDNGDRGCHPVLRLRSSQIHLKDMV
jgi:hypothetical protein